MMINVKIDSTTLVDMLMQRVENWTGDQDVYNLFEKMYENYAEGGVFDGMDFDVMTIVDNDYVNYCSIISEGEENFPELVEVYKNQGLGDCSCGVDSYGFIEAVDNEGEPTIFLVRH